MPCAFSKLEVGVGRWRRKWWNFLKFRLRKSCNNPGNHGLNLFSYLAFHYVASRKRNLDWLRSAETLSFSIFWHSFRFIYKSRFGASTCAGERTYTYSCIDQRIKCAFQMPPCIMFSLHVAIAFFCFVFPWGKKIKSGETTDVWNLATCIKKPNYQHDLKKTTIYNSLYWYVFYDNFNLLSDLFIYVL